MPDTRPTTPAALPTSQGIDPRSPRFGAAITSVLLAVTLLLTLTRGTEAVGVALLAVLAVVFAWGGFAGIRRHPYGVLYRRFVRPRLGPPAELEDPAPPTFAQRVGLVITAAGVVLALLGVPWAAAVAAALALVAALLNAVFDVCLGCLMYVWLVRARLT
ncbi:protein of unknown function [Quadrisphaera granulorum]|uniref:Uncharacterized protein DUF4395 n=1 Tax=Quadrisphaera granulorum TaxID=317664 RepID=A0A315ZUC8_9ACTN|nr:DUF4395 domain-containing protein [Quadrisphaera granulorum]PWJ48314.1 uncharacterized protein DUF4395 [Quadrisphaera granulorum]SZE98475.1 protein of unknown function [Quadrisphaera granulorum]